MGLVDFFEKRYRKLSKLKNTISDIRGKWHKRKPSIFKRKIDFSNSINNSYKYSDGNVIYEKILRLIEDTGIDVRRSLTTDLMFDNDIFEDNYNKYRKTDFIYLAPGFKTKKFKTNNLEDLLWLSGIVKEIFNEVEFGKFKLTETIVEYTAKARRDDRVPDKGLPPLEKSWFDKAKKVFKILLDETKIEENLCYSMIGAFWCEMAWAFDQPIYNKEECAGKGQPNTIGPENCGECWFGLTFWSAKEAVIKGINAPVPLDKWKYGGEHDEFTYKGGKDGTATIPTPDKTKMLCGLSEEWQVKIVNYYVEKTCGKHGKNLIGKGTGDEEEKLYSSFLFKAGGKDPTLEEVDKRVNDYIRRHEKDYGGEKNPKYRAKNGFAMQIYVAILFALYLENDEIPKTEEVDKMIGV